MTNSEFITLILSRCGRRQASQTLRDIVVSEIQSFIDMKEKGMEETPYFLEELWEDSSGTAASLELPENYLVELEETTMLFRSGEEYWIAEKVIHDNVQRIASANAPGHPRFYSILGNGIHFAPIPDASYSFTLPYGRKSTSFLANEEETSDWCKEAANAVAFTVQGIIAAQHLQDSEMASRFAQPAADAWARFNDYCNKRKFSNMKILPGEDE